MLIEQMLLSQAILRHQHQEVLVQHFAGHIQLIYKDNKLQLVDADFIENAIKNDFIDNLDKKGKGAKMKDNVLEFFSNAISSVFLIAFLIEWLRYSELKGFFMKSNAPSFIASIAVSSSA